MAAGQPAPHAAAPWPVLDPAAMHGPMGSFVSSCAPYTEADPVALLATTLVVCGAVMNSGPHMLAGNDRHPTSLFAAIVGATSKGGKGTSWAVVRSMTNIAFPGFLKDRQLAGFGSGEKLIDELARPGEDGRPRDSRLLIVEFEMARLLKAAGREGSTLSMIQRCAWDGAPLEARSRGATSVAKDYHLAAVAHITAEELKLRLSESDLFNGYVNRWLWFLVRKSQRLPEGGNVPDEILHEHAAIIGKRVTDARRASLVRRSAAAADLWDYIYNRLEDDDPGGLLGAAITRAAAQVMRLSLLYALLDGARVVDVEHLEAGHAVWRYCRASAEVLFGDRQGDPNVDRLLDAIRASGRCGLSFQDQSNVLGRNMPAPALAAMRETLEARGLVRTIADPAPTGGRPRNITVAVEYELNELNEVRGPS
jgi:hypothetical protein